MHKYNLEDFCKCFGLYMSMIVYIHECIHSYKNLHICLHNLPYNCFCKHMRMYYCNESVSRCDFLRQ